MHFDYATIANCFFDFALFFLKNIYLINYRIISTVTSLDSDQTDLFPQAIYAWLQCPNLCQNDALANLKLAIRQSTDEWLVQFSIL